MRLPVKLAEYVNAIALFLSEPHQNYDQTTEQTSMRIAWSLAEHKSYN